MNFSSALRLLRRRTKSKEERGALEKFVNAMPGIPEAYYERESRLPIVMTRRVARWNGVILNLILAGAFCAFMVFYTMNQKITEVEIGTELTRDGWSCRPLQKDKFYGFNYTRAECEANLVELKKTDIECLRHDLFSFVCYWYFNPLGPNQTFPGIEPSLDFFPEVEWNDIGAEVRSKYPEAGSGSNLLYLYPSHLGSKVGYSITGQLNYEHNQELFGRKVNLTATDRDMMMELMEKMIEKKGDLCRFTELNLPYQCERTIDMPLLERLSLANGNATLIHAFLASVVVFVLKKINRANGPSVDGDEKGQTVEENPVREHWVKKLPLPEKFYDQEEELEFIARPLWIGFFTVVGHLLLACGFVGLMIFYSLPEYSGRTESLISKIPKVSAKERCEALPEEEKLEYSTFDACVASYEKEFSKHASVSDYDVCKPLQADEFYGVYYEYESCIASFEDETRILQSDEPNIIYEVRLDDQLCEWMEWNPPDDWDGVQELPCHNLYATATITPFNSSVSKVGFDWDRYLPPGYRVSSDLLNVTTLSAQERCHALPEEEKMEHSSFEDCVLFFLYEGSKEESTPTYMETELIDHTTVNYIYDYITFWKKIEYITKSSRDAWLESGVWTAEEKDALHTEFKKIRGEIDVKRFCEFTLANSPYVCTKVLLPDVLTRISLSYALSTLVYGFVVALFAAILKKRSEISKEVETLEKPPSKHIWYSKMPLPEKFFVQEEMELLSKPRIIAVSFVFVGFVGLAAFFGFVGYYLDPKRHVTSIAIQSLPKKEGFTCAPLRKDPHYGISDTYEDCQSTLARPTEANIHWDSLYKYGSYWGGLLPFGPFGTSSSSAYKYDGESLDFACCSDFPVGSFEHGFCRVMYDKVPWILAFNVTQTCDKDKTSSSARNSSSVPVDRQLRQMLGKFTKTNSTEVLKKSTRTIRRKKRQERSKSNSTRVSHVREVRNATGDYDYSDYNPGDYEYEYEYEYEYDYEELGFEAMTYIKFFPIVRDNGIWFDNFPYSSQAYPTDRLQEILEANKPGIVEVFQAVYDLLDPAEVCKFALENAPYSCTQTKALSPATIVSLSFSNAGLVYAFAAMVVATVIKRSSRS